MSKYFMAILMMTAAATAIAERQPYERYQSIVERQMFGPLPPGFDPTKSPAEVQKTSAKEEKILTKEQEKVKSAIRFSVINVTPEGDTAIGFTDNSDPKAPVHYYLKVGEQSNGWEVKEADAEAATMTISKDGIEVSLTLGGDSAQNGDSTRRSGPRITPPPAREGGGRSIMGGSLSSRRNSRRAMREAEDARKAEALAQKEAERQAKEEAKEAERQAEKAQQEAEREEQRKQLKDMMEQLKRVREESKKTKDNNQEGEAE